MTPYWPQVFPVPDRSAAARQDTHCKRRIRLPAAQRQAAADRSVDRSSEARQERLPITPMLHGAVDTPIMSHLASRFPNAGVTSRTIEQVDRDGYQRLQSLVAQDIEGNFQSEILPVQYDDIMWRRLNRTDTPANPALQRTP